MKKLTGFRIEEDLLSWAKKYAKKKNKTFTQVVCELLFKEKVIDELGTKKEKRCK